jgi:putative acyl-CoA dehydrogenase
MPVNSIWEGSGNIMCLDVLRAFAKSPAARDAVLGELSPVRGCHRNFDAAFERFAAALDAPSLAEGHARWFAQGLVLLMQASLLLGAAGAGTSRADASRPDAAGAGVATPSGRADPKLAVAEAFCATRLTAEPGWGAVFGTSAAAIDTDAILDRAWKE